MEREDSLKRACRETWRRVRVTDEISLRSDIFLSKKQMETPSDKQLMGISTQRMEGRKEISDKG